jgi:hypothetical protein
MSGVEAVLAEHASTHIVYVAVPRRPEIRQLTYVCTCGTTLDAAVTKGEAHRRHVAAAVEAIVTRAVNEALTEAADELATEAAVVWGWNASWLTSGRKVGELAADWVRARIRDGAS